MRPTPFVRPGRSMAGSEIPRKFDAWFGRILVNACRDRLRRRKLRRHDDLDRAAATSAAADAHHVVDDRDAIGRALPVISPDHRIAVVLRYYRDLPVEEVARAVGAPVGTVRCAPPLRAAAPPQRAGRGRRLPMIDPQTEQQPQDWLRKDAATYAATAALHRRVLEIPASAPTSKPWGRRGSRCSRPPRRSRRCWPCRRGNVGLQRLRSSCGHGRRALQQSAGARGAGGVLDAPGYRTSSVRSSTTSTRRRSSRSTTRNTHGGRASPRRARTWPRTACGRS